jgi:hypothetical protein
VTFLINFYRNKCFPNPKAYHENTPKISTGLFQNKETGIKHLLDIKNPLIKNPFQLPTVGA